MNRIPFSIDLRPQIEAGEYKVVDKDNNPVTILDWDAKCYKGKLIYKYEALGVEFSNQDNGDKLFLLPKEQPLTEFEKAVEQILQEPHFQDTKSVKDFSKRLLELAKCELCLTCKEYSRGYKDGMEIWEPTTFQNLPCYAPNGICTNPQKDCINCPKDWSIGIKTFTTTQQELK